MSEGQYADVAANLGPTPLGFATFQTGPDGKVAMFRLWMQALPDQTCDFTPQ